MAYALWFLLSRFDVWLAPCKMKVTNPPKNQNTRSLPTWNYNSDQFQLKLYQDYPYVFYFYANETQKYIDFATILAEMSRSNIPPSTQPTTTTRATTVTTTLSETISDSTNTNYSSLNSSSTYSSEPTFATILMIPVLAILFFLKN